VEPIFLVIVYTRSMRPRDITVSLRNVLVSLSLAREYHPKNVQGHGKGREISYDYVKYGRRPCPGFDRC